jgi:hypothetical protein
VSTPPNIPVSVLNSARRSADRFRAEWLILINEEMMKPADLLREAARPEAKPLMKLSLRQVLLAQPGWGRRKTDTVIDHVSAISGARIDRRKITVGWLLDPRAGGRRFAAWLDAFTPKNQPWPGFPYTRSIDV